MNIFQPEQEQPGRVECPSDVTSLPRPMARIGSLELLGRESATDCGCAFTLVSAAPANALLRFEGAEIEVRKGQRDAVVRFRGAANAAATYQTGHALAQQGLDFLSMLGRVDAAIANAEDEHTLWWAEPSGLVMRIVSTATLSFGVGPVTVQVTDAQGNIVSPTPIIPQHHIGFRFFRLAQVTDDLYDAYRNMYLAFEVLLSSKFPKAKREGEEEWVRRGLQGATTDVRLTDLVPPGTSDVVDAVSTLIYRDARLRLFHAKEGREFYVPQDSPANREAVSSALWALTHIVMRMADAWFRTRRMRGSMSSWLMHQMATQAITGASIIASGDPSPFDESEADLSHSRFQDGIRLAARPAPELQRGATPALFGCSQGADLVRLPILRRLDTVMGNTPSMGQVLEIEYALDGVERLEVLTHVRAMSLNEPKSLFKT